MRKYNPVSIDGRKQFEESFVQFLLREPCNEIRLIKPEDFMCRDCGLIFEIILDKYQDNESIFFEVLDDLKARGFEGAFTIACSQSPWYLIFNSSFEKYFDHFKKMIEKDKIYTVVVNAALQLQQMDVEQEKVINELTQNIINLNSEESQEKQRTDLEIYQTFFDLTNKISDLNIAYSGLPTLNHNLKSLTGGRLVVIAGRPGQGKSALAIQIMVNAIFKEKKVGYISLEMGENEVVSRMMANHYEFNVSHLQQRKEETIQNLMNFYSNKPVPMDRFFFTEGHYKLSSIVRQVKQWQKKDISFVIIDHIGLIDAEINFNATRNDQLGKISRILKQLAQELQMPIIALSQLNRASENEKRRPHLSDLRDSGNIEQDADAVIMFYEETKTNDGIKIFDLGFLKNRAGTSGWLGPRFAFNGSLQKFTEIMLNVQVR